MSRMRLVGRQARNYVETGYTGFSSIIDKNLYFYQTAGVSAEVDGVDLARQQALLGYRNDEDYLAIHPEQKGWGRNERLRFMRKAAIQVMKEHPLLSVESHLRGILVVMFTPCATEMLQLIGLYPTDGAMPQRILSRGVFVSLWIMMERYPWVSIFMLGFQAYLSLLYVCSYKACLLTGQAAVTKKIMLCGIVLYFLLISGGAQAVGRYRLPVLPILCILASGEIANLLDKTRGGTVAGSALMKDVYALKN